MLKTLHYIWLCFTLITFSAAAQSTEDYINAYADHAQTLMRESKIPASVILAVAIHESAAGTSKIARYLNNHFGIKGANNNRHIRSSYKDYPSALESYDHFIAFLTSRMAFRTLFDKYDQYDYKNWARGIQRGGYASSRTWASQIIAIINRNNLDQYDERPEGYIPAFTPEPLVVSPGRRSITKVYKVKPGDNLYNIAKARQTTAAALMKKNGLKSPAIKPGQKLKL